MCRILQHGWVKGWRKLLGAPDGPEWSAARAFASHVDNGGSLLGWSASFAVLAVDGVRLFGKFRTTDYGLMSTV